MRPDPRVLQLSNSTRRPEPSKVQIHHRACRSRVPISTSQCSSGGESINLPYRGLKPPKSNGHPRQTSIFAHQLARPSHQQITAPRSAGNAVSKVSRKETGRNSVFCLPVHVVCRTMWLPVVTTLRLCGKRGWFFIAGWDGIHHIHCFTPLSHSIGKRTQGLSILATLQTNVLNIEMWLGGVLEDQFWRSKLRYQKQGSFQ